MKLVPKSGWSIINKKDSPVINKTGVMSFSDLWVFVFLLSILEVDIIKASFIASLGWIPNDPIPNQLLEPFLITPIPGISTSINNI